ncbi:MAG: FtsQ-type POTRA domain-containing protein [Pegethrix bostrychoides GSE-TBD4-15B]|uniref:FtsQ-type POTRA domain-containing protein n=1 Tax=Pegethrix bostrychoides GSE-TBD4-15B TaxID=2839662 RepID=A0A951U5D4_9CYAN|nr:FtsQ-type POTRA domain-containing protein [Pegethrix bostrychoides GSE-TBD4-15B]
MTDISSTSSEELTSRRRDLRRKRRGRWLQTSWQIVSMTGLTLGVIWMVTLPDWMIRDPRQIVIQGNKSLSSDMIRAMLTISYPESILALRPDALAQQLKQQAPIADATVTRRMFPPSMVVQVQERHPVATVYVSPSTSLTPNRRFDNLFATALIDGAGVWIPYEKFVALNQSQKLPALKVIGLQEQYQAQWVSLYQAVSRSPVKITMIDWREPSNLILYTDIATVHCGPFGSRFEQQLQILDQMRQLPDNIKSEQVAYIDLSNPDMPMLELAPAKTKSRRAVEQEE